MRLAICNKWETVAYRKSPFLYRILQKEISMGMDENFQPMKKNFHAHRKKFSAHENFFLWA